MISYLSGNVVKCLHHGVIVVCGGVGYELSVPLPFLAALTKQQGSASFWVYTKVREDAISLYGFPTWEERQSFSVLLQVNGLGPKVALAILSTLSLPALRQAISQNVPEYLEAVPGVGKRTAEKVLVELKGKLDRLPLQSLGGEALQRPRAESRQPLFGEAKEEDSLRAEDSWSLREQLEQDLHSALANLGFRSKDISAALAKLAPEYEREDFPSLVRRALQLLGTQAAKAPLAKGTAARGAATAELPRKDLEGLF